MPYLIAVLPNRIEAEAAYSALEAAGIPLSQLSILGRGYKSADEYGLLDPNQPAQRQMTLMSFWLVPFGFAGGVGFSILSGLQTFAWAGEIGNHVIGGILGAIGGAMGSFFVGGGVGLAVGGGDALTYRNRLRQGKYLVILEGSNVDIETSTPVLRQFAPEYLQGYQEPIRSDQ
jgi:hypothetical protein